MLPIFKIYAQFTFKSRKKIAKKYERKRPFGVKHTFFNAIFLLKL